MSPATSSPKSRVRKLESLPPPTTGSKREIRRPLSDFLVDHASTIGMSWEQIDALRPPFVIDGIVRRGEVGLMGAETKLRKSWLAQDAGFCVATGAPWLAAPDGTGGFETSRAKVHVLDLELNQSEMRFRFAKARANLFPDDLAAARAVTEAFRAYSFDGQPAEIILNYLEEIRPTVFPGDLCILDCLYRLVPDSNEAKDVAAILETIKRFAADTGAAVMLIDHFRKSGDDKARNRFAGSFVKQASAATLVAIEADADGVLTLNIDARTFHGRGKAFTSFNLETYRFDGIPESEMESAKAGERKSKDAHWVTALWKDRGILDSVTVIDAASAWCMARSGAQKRLEKLTAGGHLDRSDGTGNMPHTWALSARATLTFREVPPV